MVISYYRYGKEGGTHFLVGKPEGKIPLARSRSRREPSIKMDLQEMGLEAWLNGYGTKLGQLVCYCERENKPLGSIKCGNPFTA